MSEAFQLDPVNDLNNDIASNYRRMAVQRKSGSMSGDRLWLLREDGRLVSCTANVSQPAWPPASGRLLEDGFVKGISVDGLDRVPITVGVMASTAVSCSSNRTSPPG